MPELSVINFKAPGKTFNNLDAGTVAGLVTVSSDLALVIDKKGVIRDLALDGNEFADYDCNDWIGRHWQDTVTIESRPKVDQMLEAARSGGSSSWRQVNHGSGIETISDLPVRYSAIRLPPNDRILAIGRDLRNEARLQQKLVSAQARMENEYASLRRSETRYQALFQLTSEGVIVVDANTMRIIEANPAAANLLDLSLENLIAKPLSSILDAQSAQAANKLMAQLRISPSADDICVKTASSDEDLSLSASLFRHDAGTHYLVRLKSFAEAEAHGTGPELNGALADVISNMPDGFVVIGDERQILKANEAFLDLVQLAEEGQVLNQSIERWLGRVEVDVDILIENLREHGFIRRFTTVLRGEFGNREDIELSGVAVLDGTPPCFGLAIRKLESRTIAAPVQKAPGFRSFDQLKDLVGRVPLRELVRETTDIIEQMCIEAALELAGDNRASAAEMLGLSRQSLYVKLRRHGLGELDGQETS